MGKLLALSAKAGFAYAQLAKLAGAPRMVAAGVDLHVRVGDSVSQDQPLFTVHAQAPGELAHVLQYLRSSHEVVTLGGVR